MSETVIRSRIDSATKLEAQILLEKLGLTMSDAIRLFLRQVVLDKGLPFQVKLPEDAAREHDAWFRQQVEGAIEEADKSDTQFVAHEKVKAQWEKKRQALQTAAREKP